MGKMIKLKTIEACNYKCSYCVAGRVGFSGQRLDDLHSLQRLFCFLRPPWRVSFTGGEPFLHPRLSEIVKLAVAEGHTVDIGTNLSAPLSDFLKVAQVAGAALKSIRASFHAESVSFDEFAGKLALVSEALGSATKVSARFVVRPGNHWDLAMIERRI